VKLPIQVAGTFQATQQQITASAHPDRDDLHTIQVKPQQVEVVVSSPPKKFQDMEESGDKYQLLPSPAP